MFGFGSRVSCDPFEEDLGDGKEETLLYFTLSAQDPPSVEKSPIIVSVRSSLGEDEGMLLPTKGSWGFEISSTRIASFMMISPSSAIKTLN